MKHRLWFVIASLLLAVVFFAGCGNVFSAPSSSMAISQAQKEPTNLKVTVTNSTTYMFNELYISATAAYEWGDDHLGSTNLLKRNGSVDITLPIYEYDSYDILVVDEDDYGLLFERVTLKNGCTVEIVWEDELGAYISYPQGEDVYVTGVVDDRDYYYGALDPDDQIDPTPEPDVIPGIFEEPIAYSFGFDLYNDTPYDIEYVYLVPSSVFDAVNRGDADPLAFEILNGLNWGIFEPENGIAVRGTINKAYEQESQWYLIVMDIYGEPTSEIHMQITGQPDEWTEIHVQYDDGFMYEVWF